MAKKGSDVKQSDTLWTLPSGPGMWVCDGVTVLRANNGALTYGHYTGDGVSIDIWSRAVVNGVVKGPKDDLLPVVDQTDGRVVEVRLTDENEILVRKFMNITPVAVRPHHLPRVLQGVDPETGKKWSRVTL
jgi:hypothetical protein